jgi:hypothetical protein
MSKAVIYKQDNGVVAIIIPAPNVLEVCGIDLIAKKDVPAGKPYKIIDVSEIPTDRSMRNVWTVDDADLTDGIGANGNTFEEVVR